MALPHADERDLIASDISAYLAKQTSKELLRFITCGSVDDGKSTLIGRLLYETRQIFDDQMAALEADRRLPAQHVLSLLGRELHVTDLALSRPLDDRG